MNEVIQIFVHLPRSIQTFTNIWKMWIITYLDICYPKDKGHESTTKYYIVHKSF